MPDKPLAIDHDISSVLDAISRHGEDPVADQFTWESHPAANVPMPGEAPAPSTPAPGSMPTTGVSGSSSFRGMTDAGIKRARGVYGEADVRADARLREDQAIAAGQIARSREHYDAIGGAVGQEVDATRQFMHEEALLRQQEVDFNNGAAELEHRLAAEAQADRAAYIAQYKEQLAVVRQLSLQSGNPMGGLSQGQIAGLAGAQFAQGFLAAQGINIDVAGQVDRWVDRSIQEHQMKIQNARTAAEDQLHLYQLSRQNSEDEWEARQRYRGFVIAGLQASIGLNATRFQSDIAMARANQQIARLQVEADATERSIADNYLKNRNAIYESEYRRAHDLGQLAIQQQAQSLALRRQKWEEEQAKKKKEEAVDARDFTIQDIEYVKDANGKEITDANGNRIQMNRWRIKPEIMADDVLARKVYEDALDARNSFAEYDDATKEMIDAYTRAKARRDSLGVMSKVSWDAAARLDGSGEINLFLQARDNWVQKRVKALSGASTTKDEREYIAKQAYKDKLFSVDNGEKSEKSYARLRQEGVQSLTRKLEGITVEIPEGDRARIGKSVSAAPRTQAENKAAIYGQKPEPGFVDVQEGKAIARDSEDIATTNSSGTWADFQRDVQMARGDEIKFGQPEYAQHVDRIVAAYARPRYIYKVSPQFGVKLDKDESPAEIRRDAYAALSSLASGKTRDGQEVPADVQEYAWYMKQKLDEDSVLSPLKDGGDEIEDVGDSPLIKAMQPRKR